MLEKAPRSPLDQDSAEEPATDGNKAGGAGLDEQRRTDIAPADREGAPADRTFRLPRWRRRTAAATPVAVAADSRGDVDTPAGAPVDTGATDAPADDAPARGPGNAAPADTAAVDEPTDNPADNEPTDNPADEEHPDASDRLQDVRMVGGVVLASDWRTREKTQRRGLRGLFASRIAQARQLAERWPSRADVGALLAERPTREDLRALAAKRPTGDEVRATLRKHRVLIGGVTIVALFAAADSSFTDLVSDRGPAPGQAQRIAVAYPWQMQTTTPSVRRYLDAVDHGERLREAAVVAAAARATLERARTEAAAAAAGERQPWMGTPPPPAITMTPGEVLPGGIAPGAGGYVLPAIGVFTSGFGQRWGTFHNGIDVAGPIGTPIYAVANGTVIDAGPAQGFGLWVRIRHDDGSISVYGHMYDFFVSVGERVPAGMQIARMGNRGDSTGPHLHFEVIVGGQHVDPQRWLALHGLTYS
ncbi:M23 family metallopeptidase [Nocardia cyriacigeorgica]|uniref:M23 family metallopeptidase n=1 Tax=Nocardia cyriacigeorgica TaxID=135487 RepID=UPI001E2C0AFD|nr:M23 family metallopeptidase [Nocardia cyriacigeorgica]